MIITAAIVVEALVQSAHAIGAGLSLVDQLRRPPSVDAGLLQTVTALRFGSATVDLAAVILVAVGWSRAPDLRSPLIRAGLAVALIGALAEAAASMTQAVQIARLSVPGFPDLQIPGQSTAVTAYALLAAGGIASATAFAVATATLPLGSWNENRRTRDKGLGLAVVAYAIGLTLAAGSATALLVFASKTDQPRGQAILLLIGTLVGTLAFGIIATGLLGRPAATNLGPEVTRRRDSIVTVGLCVFAVAAVLVAISAMENAARIPVTGLDKIGLWTISSSTIIQIAVPVTLAVAFSAARWRRAQRN